MRSLTIALPLISFLVALVQGLCPMDPSMDAGADPRTERIMSKYKRREALRLGPARRELARGDVRVLIASANPPLNAKAP